MCALTFCAAHVQWPLHLLARACCCMTAPETSVTGNGQKWIINTNEHVHLMHKTEPDFKMLNNQLVCVQK